MTTDMKTAIQKAGITLPMNQRIWMWLKDNPKKTNAQIAAALKEKDNNVATLCKDLLDRGMVTREFESRSGKAGKGWTVRDVALYTVNPKMQTYELWPKKTAPKAPQKEAPKAALPLPVTMLEPGEFRAPPPWTPEVHCTGLSLGHCRQLYDYLQTIFNPKEK